MGTEVGGGRRVLLGRCCCVVSFGPLVLDRFGWFWVVLVLNVLDAVGIETFGGGRLYCG